MPMVAKALTFRDPADWSSRFSHWLRAHDIGIGEYAAIMVGPSLMFYAGFSGAMKRGTIAVPLFTLFGPDGVLLRVSMTVPGFIGYAGPGRALQPRQRAGVPQDRDHRGLGITRMAISRVWSAHQM